MEISARLKNWLVKGFTEGEITHNDLRGPILHECQNESHLREQIAKEIETGNYRPPKDLPITLGGMKCLIDQAADIAKGKSNGLS